MSPALTASVSLPATTLSGSQPAHVNPHWNNPHPEGWRELDDNRKFCFQADHNLFLEMHSNGTRGVNATTKFCVLTILIMNITRVSLNNDSSQQLVKQWSQNRDTAFGREWRGPESSARHVILGNATGLFLCMNDQSVVYQTRNFDTNHCVFDHEYENYTDRYFRKLNSTSEKWYLGMNKDGSMRCGNVTGKHQRGAKFIKIFVDGKAVSESPPFEPPKKECCTKKSCKKRRIGKRRCYKNWCNRHRRRFFTLTLKELRRYYNRCVKKADKVRHCSRKVKRHCTKTKKGKRNVNR